MINLTSKTGVPFTVDFNISHTAVDNIGHADGWDINLGRQVLSKEDIILEIKGNKAESVDYYTKGNTDFAPREVIKALNNGAFAVLCGRVMSGKNQCVLIILDEANAKAYLAAYNAAKAAGTTPEAAELLDARRQKMKAEAEEELKEILERAKRSPKNEDGSLFTEAQKKEYLKNYNNLYNEGGGGYLPDVVTKEAIEHFRNKINQSI